jgi:membrane protease YdiL (CAAX protease family)
LSQGEDSFSAKPELTVPVAGEHATAPVGEQTAIIVGEDPAWGIWEVVRIAVVALIAIGLMSMVAVGLAVWFAGMRPLPSDLARNARVVVPPQFAAYLILLGYMAWLVRSRGRAFWQSIQWNWPGAKWFGWVALGVALAMVVQSASALLPIPKSLPIDRYFRDTVGAYMMAAFGLTLAPLVEELFFRGFLYPALARLWGLAAGVLITAALFAMIHTSQLANAWAPLLLLFFVGIVLTVLRARTRSVATTFLVHVGYNGTLFTMLYLASDHFRHFEKLG